MFHLLYDPLDRIQSFTLIEVVDNDIHCYRWFNLNTLPDMFLNHDGKLENTSIDHLIDGTSWILTTSFPSMPTTDQLKHYIHSHPELLI